MQWQGLTFRRIFNFFRKMCGRIRSAHHVYGRQLTCKDGKRDAGPSASVFEFDEDIAGAGLGSVDADGYHDGEEGHDVQNEEEGLDSWDVSCHADVGDDGEGDVCLQREGYTVSTLER